MALESFTKQPYEEFMIAGDFTQVLESTETIVVGTSTVTATDKSTGEDTSATVLDASTKEVDGTQLRCRCRAGLTGEQHKITFRAVTSEENKWEIDVIMKVKET
jgi:hypothetical protein